MIRVLLTWLERKQSAAMQLASEATYDLATMDALGRVTAFAAARTFALSGQAKDAEQVRLLLSQHQKASLYLGGEQFLVGFTEAQRDICAWLDTHPPENDVDRAAADLPQAYEVPAVRSD